MEPTLTTMVSATALPNLDLKATVVAVVVKAVTITVPVETSATANSRERPVTKEVDAAERRQRSLENGKNLLATLSLSLSLIEKKKLIDLK